MIPHIPHQRQHASGKGGAFGDLVAYIEENKSQQIQHMQSPAFEKILNYTVESLDKTTNEEKCIAIRTNRITDIVTAATEMNAISSRNTRCKDPAFHFILSWPEHERPDPEKIFDAATHALTALGLAEHQYVMAIHGNTDNMHCHIAVNRINPDTFKSKNIEWAKKTLHMAARESEIKHGWSHDNGIYIVQERNKQKTIILNPDRANGVLTSPHAHKETKETDAILPAWHDPDSLESWLKKDVTRALKRALPAMKSWEELHSWLSKSDITLSDTGGGGMRLHATSPESGEILDLPASKGLRILKRAELETKWGPYRNLEIQPPAAPDFSNLTQKQIQKGVEHVLRRDLDQGIPPNHVLRANPVAIQQPRPPADRTGSLHELSAGGVDGEPQDAGLLLPDAVPKRMGHESAGQDNDVRRPDAGETSSRRLARDNSKREERRNQRAAARFDLRNRYSQYKRFVRDGDHAHKLKTKELFAERREKNKEIRHDAKLARQDVYKDKSLSQPDRLHALVEIDTRCTRRLLEAESSFQTKNKVLSSTRLPSLGWREWLHEQSNLGDQAAVSALRGIVYQARRDAKAIEQSRTSPDGQPLPPPSPTELEDEEETSYEAHERQHKKLLARLIEEEKKEIAIRSARINSMRPYEADVIMSNYRNMQYRVTGNGNVEYSTLSGSHLFTDRGNRVTFDRVIVTDDDIRLALAHSKHKFGNKVTLTGDDQIFAARMARIADDMGITVINPELQQTIKDHRDNLKTAKIDAANIQIETETSNFADHDASASSPYPTNTDEEKLRAKIRAIDPRAQFINPDPQNAMELYSGPIAAILDDNSNPEMFAQNIGRSIYAIHTSPPPAGIPKDTSIDIKYHQGKLAATTSAQQQQKDRRG